MNQTELLQKITTDKQIRLELARQSHNWFFHIYLNNYVTYPTAVFQREMLAITEQHDPSMLVVMAFRGSGKSTIMSLSYPLWAILGVQQKRCILLLSQTQYQAQLLLQHLKSELEQNPLLRKDFGPFMQQSTQWSADTIIIPKYGAKIIAASAEQSVRGIRHGAVRPDLIICDDIEDLNAVKSREVRNRTFQWLMGEIIPAGDVSTRVVVVGNLLHEDALMVRLEQLITDKELTGVVRRYPFMVGEIPLWKEKFPTPETVERERRKIANPIAWNREYNLKIIPEEGQIITYDDIHYYDDEPTLYEPIDITEDEQSKTVRLERIATGIDLAISQKTDADCTAMVSVKCFGFYHDSISFYIVPKMINKRLNFKDTIDQAINLSRVLGQTHPTELFVEQVAYQQVAIESLKRAGLPTKGVTVNGSDKRARLNIVAPLIQQGRIKFPKKGAEELIAQIVGFGVERHDDLMDAFTLVIMQMMNDYPSWQPSDMDGEEKPIQRKYYREPEFGIRDDDEDEDDDKPVSYFGTYRPHKWNVFM